MRIGVASSTARTTASAIAWSGALSGCTSRRTPSASVRARAAAPSGIAATTLSSAVRASRAHGVSSSRRSPTAIATASAGREVERRQRHRAVEHVAAAPAELRRDRHARLLQGEDVALDRPHAHLEALRQAARTAARRPGRPQLLDERIEPVEPVVHDARAADHHKVRSGAQPFDGADGSPSSRTEFDQSSTDASVRGGDVPGERFITAANSSDRAGQRPANSCHVERPNNWRAGVEDGAEPELVSHEEPVVRSGTPSPRTGAAPRRDHRRSIQRGEGDDDDLVGLFGHAGTYCRHGANSSREPDGHLEVGEDVGIPGSRTFG